MKSRYWIKLYHEILHDPKIGQLPDWLWRRMIEFFVLAGEAEMSGKLQPVPDMLWILHLDEVSLREALQRLTEIGVVHQDAAGDWWVTHFVERQDADTSAERMKRFRDKEETKAKRNALRSVTQVEVEKEEEIEKELTTTPTPSPGLKLAEYPIGFQIVCELAHWPDIPHGQIATIESNLQLLVTRHPKRAELLEYCRKFADEYYRRYPGRTSAGWLDWAVMGNIPDERFKKNGHSPPRGKSLTDVAKERAALKAKEGPNA